MSDTPDREWEFAFQIHQQHQSQNAVNDMDGLLLYAWILETELNLFLIYNVNIASPRIPLH